MPANKTLNRRGILCGGGRTDELTRGDGRAMARAAAAHQHVRLGARGRLGSEARERERVVASGGHRRPGRRRWRHRQHGHPFRRHPGGPTAGSIVGSIVLYFGSIVLYFG